jgi:hypothetical protein
MVDVRVVRTVAADLGAEVREDLAEVDEPVAVHRVARGVAALVEKCRATYGSAKIAEDGKVTMVEHFGPCQRSMRSYVAERALRWLGHVARMPSDKLPRRMLTAWV